MIRKIVKVGIAIGILLLISGCVEQSTTITTKNETISAQTNLSFSAHVLVTPDNIKNQQSLSRITDQIKVNAIEIPYDNLVKDNENQIGKFIKIRLDITQIDSDGNMIAVPLKSGDSLDIESSTPIYLLYKGKPVELYDIIDIYGEVEGLKNIPQPVPEIKVLYAELVKKS